MRIWRLQLLIVLALPLVLTGCFDLSQYDQTVVEKNQELADKTQDKYGESLEEGKERLKEYTKAQIAKIAQELTEKGKQEIEQWLDEQNFNKYGDAVGTMYTGGTPLFNEMTGETKNRFEYILEQHPELIEQFNLQNE